MMRETTLHPVFREFKPQDYAQLVEIQNAIYPDYPTTVDEIRFSDDSLDKSKYHVERYACVDRDSGTILGFARIANSSWTYHPKKFHVSIIVDPKHQRRGVGSQIYEKVVRELEKLNATIAWVRVKEDVPWSVAFAKKRDFVEKRRTWDSTLNPSAFDPTIFQRYTDRAKREGIGISTLAEEEARDPSSIRRLHALFQDVSMDVPLQGPYTPVSYDEWVATEIKNPNHLTEGYFIASDGPRYVGMSNVWRIQKEPRSLVQAMTGVQREYRGRGIAIALKLAVIDFARRNNYDKIITSNDSENAPMLAVNTKLGFKRLVGWITMEKRLC